MLSLGATKTSHRWQEMPGNWDRLNTRALYPSSNSFGIPDLPYTNKVPAGLVAYNSKYAIANAKPGDAVHFFLDDYRFEVTWTKPEKGVMRPVKVGMALTPDFSLWSQMPLVMQQWQVYRSRWCGLWMINRGVDVIPTISWSTPASYSFAFLGVAEGSTVAISTVGTSKEVEPAFHSGVLAMCEAIRPGKILVYGRKLECLEDLANVIFFPYKFGDR